MIKQAIETGDFGHDTGGSVALVGAGPGARDLITLRGVQRLQEADVIYYDRLVDPEILELARRDAMRIYVGKQPGCHSWPQEKITQTMVTAAKNGARVVRLKCGDPAIFARSLEEMEALRDAAIPFEIVPGVTAASAAAAAANIPLTRRLTARRMQFITGHDVTGGLPDSLNMAALADPDATTVVYMGIRTFAALAEKLIEAGLPPETHALIALGVSTPEQELSCHTVGELPQVLRNMETSAPVLILYGPLADSDLDSDLPETA
jgi:uroporphyrin-III C-methyltransferase